jgi:hypothetical protein
MKLATRLAFALFMAAALSTARAEEAFEREAQTVAMRFVQLAGSEDNALALVLALRQGVPVQLVTEREGGALPETLAVMLPTGPMPWSDVRIALLHAQDMLLRAGLTRPTPAALQAALVGGDIVGLDGATMPFRGVLQMRADGLGWVEIARLTAPANTSPAFLGR